MESQSPQCRFVLCCAQLLQLCLTLCDPMDCSLPGSSIHRILQARSGMGCYALLQGIFPTQGSNLCLLCLLHGRQILYPDAPQILILANITGASICLKALSGRICCKSAHTEFSPSQSPYCLIHFSYLLEEETFHTGCPGEREMSALHLLSE